MKPTDIYDLSSFSWVSKSVDVVNLDLQKAFDKFLHHKLLNKSKHLDIDCQIYK